MSISLSNKKPAALDLAGKHVLVTGGTHGIGAAAVRLAVDAGAVVSLCSRSADDVNRATSISPSRFGTICDVSNEGSVEALFDSAERRLGPVHGVIHAAAVIGPIGPIVDLNAADWLEALKIDLFGAFLVTREACKRMNAVGGRIALFSGGGAAGPFPNYTAYACSKVGVVRFVESVALEIAEKGIEINAVAPGFVGTRMHLETLAAGSAAGATYLEYTKRALAADAVSPDVGAHCAAWLVSEAASGISGKFVAAPYDSYTDWPSYLSELRDSDIFTLRRVLPRERNLDWQ